MECDVKTPCFEGRPDIGVDEVGDGTPYELANLLFVLSTVTPTCGALIGREDAGDEVAILAVRSDLRVPSDGARIAARCSVEIDVGECVVR